MTNTKENLKRAIKEKDEFSLLIIYNRLLQTMSHDDIMKLVTFLVEETTIERARTEYFKKQ